MSEWYSSLMSCFIITLIHPRLWLFADYIVLVASTWKRDFSPVLSSLFVIAHSFLGRTLRFHTHSLCIILSQKDFRISSLHQSKNSIGPKPTFWLHVSVLATHFPTTSQHLKKFVAESFFFLFLLAATSLVHTSLLCHVLVDPSFFPLSIALFLWQVMVCTICMSRLWLMIINYEPL